jgi:hypothetical protein
MKKAKLCEKRVIVRAGLTLRQFWHEAIQAAKQRCEEQCFKDATEEPPRCEHGELIFDGPEPCWHCDFLEQT